MVSHFSDVNKARGLQTSGAIVGMRNHIAHGYFEIDADIILETIKSDAAPLLATIQKAMQVLKV